MNLPAYLIDELLRRLERGNPPKEMVALLNAVGINTEEPGPAPDFEAMVERYDGICQTGCFKLSGTLDFLGYQTPVHFRVSYAGPIDDDEPLDQIRGPAMQLDLLNWSDDGPNWVSVDPSLLSERMIDDIWPAISLHASQAKTGNSFRS